MNFNTIVYFTYIFYFLITNNYLTLQEPLWIFITFYKQVGVYITLRTRRTVFKAEFNWQKAGRTNYYINQNMIALDGRPSGTPTGPPLYALNLHVVERTVISFHRCTCKAVGLNYKTCFFCIKRSTFIRMYNLLVKDQLNGFLLADVRRKRIYWNDLYGGTRTSD